MDVELVPVDEQVLGRLVRLATEEAIADEVTPPLTRGDEWNEVRRQWFMDYHRDRRDQLAEQVGESTWAVMLGGRPVGAVRLKRSPDDATLETGVWLARSIRGQGVGAAALTAVADLARANGADMVIADTAAANLAAQAAMRRAGFRLAAVDPDGRVRGTLPLEPGSNERPMTPSSPETRRAPARTAVTPHGC